MATSNFAPPAGTIKLIRDFSDVKKINVSTHPRAFPTGSLLWLNKVSGRYQAEPALESPTNATTDSTSGNSADSTYASLDAANAAFAPLFLGVAAEARVPQQLNQFGQFGVQGAASVYPMDASKPFISYYDSGIATMPVGPTLAAAGVLTSTVEPGTLVYADGFVNETSVGFYDPAGALQIADAKYFLYNNCVTTTATAADAIGVVVERGEIGQSVLVVKFKAAVFSTRLGGV